MSSQSNSPHTPSSNTVCVCISNARLVSRAAVSTFATNVRMVFRNMISGALSSSNACFCTRFPRISQPLAVTTQSSTRSCACRTCTRNPGCRTGRHYERGKCVISAMPSKVMQVQRMRDNHCVLYDDWGHRATRQGVQELAADNQPYRRKQYHS